MEKYYRFSRAKYNYWFGKDAMSVWALPIIIPIGIIAALVSVLGAVLFYIGAIIVVPVDGILSLFNKALVWVIEKAFMRGEKKIVTPLFQT